MENNTNDKPEMTMELAEKTLENVFSACNIEPNKTPISKLLDEHKNIMRFHHSIIYLSVLALLLLALSPLAFIRPYLDISTSHIDQDKIIMKIQTSQIIPAVSVQATINGQPMAITKVTDSLYLAEITENGEFKAIVTGLNFQTSHQTATISNID